MRYDKDVTAEVLRRLGLWDVRPESVQVMDSVGFVADIRRAGQAYGGSVSLDHLKGFV